MHLEWWILVVMRLGMPLKTEWNKYRSSTNSNQSSLRWLMKPADCEPSLLLGETGALFSLSSALPGIISEGQELCLLPWTPPWPPFLTPALWVYQRSWLGTRLANRISVPEEKHTGHNDAQNKNQTAESECLKRLISCLWFCKPTLKLTGNTYRLRC